MNYSSTYKFSFIFWLLETERTCVIYTFIDGWNMKEMDEKESKVSLVLKEEYLSDNGVECSKSEASWEVDSTDYQMDMNKETSACRNTVPYQTNLKSPILKKNLDLQKKLRSPSTDDCCLVKTENAMIDSINTSSTKASKVSLCTFDKNKEHPLSRLGKKWAKSMLSSVEGSYLGNVTKQRNDKLPLLLLTMIFLPISLYVVHVYLQEWYLVNGESNLWTLEQKMVILNDQCKESQERVKNLEDLVSKLTFEMDTLQNCYRADRTTFQDELLRFQTNWDNMNDHLNEKINHWISFHKHFWWKGKEEFTWVGYLRNIEMKLLNYSVSVLERLLIFANHKLEMIQSVEHAKVEVGE